MSSLAKSTPSGINAIIVFDAAERFAYYGMLILLPTFFIHEMNFSETKMVTVMHFLYAIGYTFGFIAYAINQKYSKWPRFIILYALISLVGHIIFGDTSIISMVSLCAIYAASGMLYTSVWSFIKIKCQTEETLNKAISKLYWATNMGTISLFILPFVLDKTGSYFIAFTCASVAMFIAIMFLLISKKDRSAILGTKTETENNASVLFLIKKAFFKKPTEKELTQNLKDELKFFKLLIYQICFMSLYLVLFSQLDTSFIAQGMHMNAEVLGFTILPNQLPFWNTAFVLAFLPVFKGFLLPVFERFKILNKKIDQMIVGIMFVASSFLFTAWEQYEIEQGTVFSILIHAIPYTLLSIGEIFFMFVSVNYVYAMAPKSMSNMCSLATNCAYLIGNIIVSLIASRFTDLCVTYFLIFASIALALALYLSFSMRRKNMYS